MRDTEAIMKGEVGDVGGERGGGFILRRWGAGGASTRCEAAAAAAAAAAGSRTARDKQHINTVFRTAQRFCL